MSTATLPTLPTPHLLIIVFDAARAENFSAYGYEKATTPNLTRWAERMSVFDQCISAATWTLPSTAGLFTGTHESTHGLVLDGDRLRPDFTTMAEMLKGMGYFTAKVTGEVPYVSGFSGLDRGFTHNYEPPPSAARRLLRSLKRRKAQKQGVKRHEGVDLGLDISTEAAMAAKGGFKNRLRYWGTGLTDCGASACFQHVRELWQEKSGQPKFVYMHLQETHAEYRPPHRYRTRFLDARLKGRNFAAINQRPNPHDAGLVKMTAEEYEILTGLYDGCIAYLDEQTGRFLDDLSRSREFDNTMVVITADHGDCLGRHGVLGHQFVCYDALVHIPWFIKWPTSVAAMESTKAGHNGRLVQNIDLLPTVCDVTGAKRPEQCEGRSMLSAPPRETAISENLKPFGVSAINQGLHTLSPHLNRAVLSVRSRTHKLVAYSNHAPEEWYDLTSDPKESRNLLAEKNGGNVDQGELARLRGVLEGWKPKWQAAAAKVNEQVFRDAANPAGALNADIDPEIAERLRSLGYLD